MKKSTTLRSITITFLLFLSTGFYSQAVIEHWMVNTTGNTYLGDSTDVKKVYYNNNYVFITAEGIPSYYPAYTGSSVFEPVAQGYTYRVKREPQLETGTHQSTLQGGMGVAINGAPFYQNGDAKSWDVTTSSFIVAGADIWHSLAWEKEGLDMDGSYGHSTASGNYHHHVADMELFDNAASSVHSPLIGYAFDGFPIYGPFGYSNPMDNTSGISRMISSWQELSESDLTNGMMDDVRRVANGVLLTNASDYGPTINASNPIGVCREDYEYISGLGTLDEYNGRWCVTPEYPCGIYAYFVTLDAAGDALFPYICGNEYAGVMDYVNSNQFVNASLPGGAVEWDYASNICSTTLTETINDATCANNDGNISLVVAGFGDSICYNWSNGMSTANISGLAAGTYTVTVTGNSCSHTEMYTVAGGAGSTATVTGTNPTGCGASDGEISFGPPSGTPPYQFSIDSGATFSSTMPPIFSGLAAGTYYTVLEDGNGCWELDTIVLTASGSTVIYTVTIADDTCGMGVGSFDITASGGDGGPYNYSIDGGTTTQGTGTFSGLSSGSYNIYIEDGAGCTVSGIETIGGTAAPIFDSVTIVDPLCNGGADGQITVHATGSGAMMYGVDGGTPQSSNVITGLMAGAYAIDLIDGGCVTATGSHTVTEPTAIGHSATTVPESGGGSNGSIDLTVSGGTPGYTFSWTPGGSTVEDPTGLTAGTYNVVITDANGCTSNGTYTVNSTVNVAEVGINVKVGPNPTTGILFIQVTNAENTSCELTDLLGKSIYKGSFNHAVKIDLSDYQTGVYLLSISDGSSRSTLKVIKQ